MIPDGDPAFSYVHPMRSRYGETDKMGYVYYGRYLEYFEEARTEMIRSLGMPYSSLEEQGYMLPVVHAAVDYKAPLFYDERFFVHVHLYRMPSVKMETWYEIRTERTDQPHAAGKVILCFMKDSSRKPCRGPEAFLQGLAEQMK